MKLKHKADMEVAEVSQFLLRQPAHVNIVNHDAARVGLVERADDLQQRRLTGTGGADNAHHLAFVDVEVDTFQHL